jgi:hypothetical protein
MIWLLFAHHLGDVAFQPSWLIEAKKKHLWAIFEHVMIYSGVLSFTLWFMGKFELWHFWYFLIGHFIIDAFFYRVLPHLLKKDKQYHWVYYDQALHYLQIIILYFVIL